MKRTLALAGLIVIIIVLAVIWRHNDAGAPGQNNPAHPQSHQTQPADGKAPAFDKTAHSTTDPASIWVVVNKQHPLTPKTYAPTDLTSVGNGQLMRAAAAAALKQMLAGAKQAGYVVTAASGYRSYSDQVAAYDSEVAAYGQAKADSESARPGYSEHQTGLAVDLASGGCSITDCFGSTPGGQWVTANAWRYGFILRYAPGLEQITGYRTETWHFRYVGQPLAKEMHKTGIKTLEQFFNITGGTSYN